MVIRTTFLQHISISNSTYSTIIYQNTDISPVLHNMSTSDICSAGVSSPWVISVCKLVHYMSRYVGSDQFKSMFYSGMLHMGSKSWFPNHVRSWVLSMETAVQCFQPQCSMYFETRGCVCQRNFFQESWAILCLVIIALLTKSIPGIT